VSSATTISATQSSLRIVTAGSVDDGKSTLIGRLLYDSKSILSDQLEQVAEASRRRNGDDGIDLSLLTDGLRAEREQGITIDVAYRYFATAKRSFILADTPGHVQYTRNMVTGASTADLAILLIDARLGVLEQTRRHAFIASLLGIPHLAVCVNKMDMVDFDQSVFDQIIAEFSSFAARLSTTDVAFFPVSALHGDNIVTQSERTPWYRGSPLLYHLETVYIASDRNLVDVRFPVQWVIRDHDSDYRGYAGQVASGIMRPGDEIVVLPSGATSSIAAIDTLDGELAEAFAPMSVTVRLTDDVDVSRGDVICRPHNQGQVSREIDAMICWMSERPCRAGARYDIRHGARSTPASVSTLLHRIDIQTLHRQPDVEELGLNDIARVHLRTAKPLVFDPYSRNRRTGGFILVDKATGDTVAAGMILGSDADTAVRTEVGERSSNVVWEQTGVTRQARRELGFAGAVLWLTGLPGAGKSTVAGAVEERLLRAGRLAYRLDGDNLRHGLNGDLGFDPAARAENVRRTAHAARLLADAGAQVVVSLVSPYAADRDAARRVAEQWEIPFYEVWISTPLDVCEERDPKGLYARARSGEMVGMTGVDDPYEAPSAPALVLSGEGDVAAAADAVIALLDGI
jgi:bifunctional enzyme CysN/CysC